MQAEQLRGIVELLRRGLRDADVSKVPRLIEEEGEEEDDNTTIAPTSYAPRPRKEDDTTTIAPSSNASLATVQPREVQAEMRLVFARNSSGNVLQQAPPSVDGMSSGHRGTPLSAALLDLKEISRASMRPSSPVQHQSPTRSPPQVQFRSPQPNQRATLGAMPQRGSSPPTATRSSQRPGSPRQRSLEKNPNVCEPSPSSYVRGTSHSRSNLRMMSPDASVQARGMSPDASVQALLPPPAIRAPAPPASPARVVSSRRTLPARMAGIPASWFPTATAAAASASGAAPAQPRLVSTATGSVQLAAAGGHGGGPTIQSRPSAAPCVQPMPGSSNYRDRSPEGWGAPAPQHSAAAPPGRPSGLATNPAGPSVAAAANAAVAASEVVRASEVPPTLSRTALRAVQPWQTTASQRQPATMPTSPISGDRRLISASGLAMQQATAMNASLLKVRADYTSMPRLPQYASGA